MLFWKSKKNVDLRKETKNKGMPMKNCKFIGGQVVFDRGKIHYCCSCTHGERPVACGFWGGSFPEEEFRGACERLVSANQTSQSPCDGCFFLKEESSYGPFRRLDGRGGLFVWHCNINCFEGCNLKCEYCDVKHLPFQHSYDVSVPLEDMFQRGIMDARTYISWGGGEPTLYKYFDKTVKLISEFGAAQNINTNATVFSEELAHALVNESRTFMQVSIDSATRETYEAVKGLDLFEKVRENLGKYAAVKSEGVRLKYIVTERNKSESEVSAFINLCKEIGIRRIVVSGENSLMVTKNYGDHLIKTMGTLARMAEQAGIRVEEVVHFFDARQLALYGEYAATEKSGR